MTLMLFQDPNFGDNVSTTEGEGVDVETGLYQIQTNAQKIRSVRAIQNTMLTGLL